MPSCAVHSSLGRPGAYHHHTAPPHRRNAATPQRRTAVPLLVSHSHAPHITPAPPPPPPPPPPHRSGMLRHISVRGAFFVQHPFLFPTAQFHHPAAVRGLGCHAPDGSLPHCATTFMGFTLNSAVGREAVQEVLKPLVSCGLDEACVFPEGSSRQNHRQEQTALNAVLCAHGERQQTAWKLVNGMAVPVADGSDGSDDSDTSTAGAATPAFDLTGRAMCSNDLRYRLTSDFENVDAALRPTVDPTDFNEMAFYTRRRHPTKPYAPFLQRRV